MNVKIDYLPKELLQSKDCNDRCSNILDGNVVGNQPVSIKSSFLAGTSYAFSIEIDFGRKYIGAFSLEIEVNPSIAQQYFNNIDASEKLVVQIDPKFLSLVQEKTKLS